MHYIHVNVTRLNITRPSTANNNDSTLKCKNYNYQTYQLEVRNVCDDMTYKTGKITGQNHMRLVKRHKVSSDVT